MGVIARQSFKAGIATYVGVALGVLNNIFIYPLMLSVEQYGEIQFILQTATFFTPLLLLGFGSVLTKFFPEYKNELSERRKFYSIIYGVVTLNIIFFLLLFLVFKESILTYYSQSAGVANYSVYVLVGVSILMPYMSLAKNYSANYGRIAVPSLISHLLKLFLPLFVIGFYYKLFSFEYLIYLLLIYHVLLLAVYVAYSNRHEKIRFSFDIKKYKGDALLKPIALFALYSVISGVGTTLTNQIDILMITSMKGTYANGLYAWSLFIANAIAIPYALIATIAMPIIAQYWKDMNLDDLQVLYRKSASSLLVLSLGVFCSFWLIVDDVFALMPKGDEYKLAKNVILLLCVSKIIDMASGLNTQIISMSKNYKVLLYMLGTAVVLNIGLNVLLIPKYGIDGSAVATIISIIVFNFLKFSYIKRKFHMQPFTYKTLIAIALVVLIYFISRTLPRSSNAFLNILYISGFSGLLYFGAVYNFKLAPELNSFINKQLQKLGFK